MSGSSPSPRRFARRTRVSWGARLGNALVGVLVGIALVIGGLVLLAWNEGRAVQTARSLAEAGGIVASVGAERIEPAREGELVHVTGTLSVPEPVADPEFDVAERAARLVRTVEMYQWEEERRSETRTRAGGAEERVTTYEYRPVWSDRAIDSSRFEHAADHRNPPKAYESRELLAQGATLGAFQVGSAILRQLPADTEVRIGPEAADVIAKRFEAPARIADGRILVGEDPANPQIGDLRISYNAAPAGPISVVGRQTSDSFAPYQTRAGDAILLAQAGTAPADQMIRAAERENTIMAWLLRGAGAAAIFLGFAMVLRPIAVFGDVIPIVGRVLRAGSLVVAAAATAVLGPLVIALAWLAYRPVMAAAILIAGLAAAYGIERLRGGRAPARKIAQAKQ